MEQQAYGTLGRKTDKSQARGCLASDKRLLACGSSLIPAAARTAVSTIIVKNPSDRGSCENRRL